MANVVLTRTQFWSMIVLGAITLVYLIYASFDFQGQADRAIIKEDIRRVLGNISHTEDLQRLTLREHADTQRQILHFEETAENRSMRLFPSFERFINQSESLLNETRDLFTLQKSAKQDRVNILGNLTEIINLLNTTG